MDLADQALKMAGALGIVVTLLLVGMFLMKRLMGDSTASVGQSMLRMMGGLRLGQGKAIMLVEVAGEILVLASTTRDLTLLTRVQDKERVEQLRTNSGHTIGRLGLLPFGLWRNTENISSVVSDKDKPAHVPLSVH